MSFPRFAFVLLAAGLCPGAPAQAQKTSEPTVDNAFVEQQFGSNCKLVGMPSLRGDLDGDGVEDIVIPAHCTSPLMDQAQNNYVVIDPYDSFFGYGNPKVTTAFVADDPQRRGFSLLVIHGSGPDAWHAAVPKAKFHAGEYSFPRHHDQKDAGQKETPHGHLRGRDRRRLP